MVKRQVAAVCGASILTKEETKKYHRPCAVANCERVYADVVVRVGDTGFNTAVGLCADHAKMLATSINNLAL